MPALVLKSLPASLHAKLKRAATRNRRSMTQQAILLLQQSLEEAVVPGLARRPPKPVSLKSATGKKVNMTDAMLRRAREAGRA